MDDMERLAAEQEERFKELYKCSSAFSRAVALDSLLEAVPNDYGTGETSNFTEAHMMIDVCDHEGITVGELATLSCRTPSAVSQIASRLESKGYLYKQRSKTNYRSYHLYPTEKGVELATAHKKYDIEHITSLHEFLLEACSPQEVEAFYKVLDRRTEYVTERLGKLKEKK